PARAAQRGGSADGVLLLHPPAAGGGGARGRSPGPGPGRSRHDAGRREWRAAAHGGGPRARARRLRARLPGGRDVPGPGIDLRGGAPGGRAAPVRATAAPQARNAVTQGFFTPASSRKPFTVWNVLILASRLLEEDVTLWAPREQL